MVSTRVLLHVGLVLLVQGIVIVVCQQERAAGAGDEDNQQPCPYTNNQSELNSFLWTIHRDPPSYFFGSIHVPFNKVWNHVPDNSKEAFQRSDHVYFELDLMDQQTLTSLARCQLLPEGQKLSDVIPPDLFRRLKQHLQYVKTHLPEWITPAQRMQSLNPDTLFNAITGNWEHKRPVWVMLMVNSLTENSVKTKGIPVLDLYLAQVAERMGKRTGAIEKVEEHCIPLNELNLSQALFTLNQTLWQQEQHYRSPATAPAAAVPAYTTADLIRHYNCGDLDTIIYSADSAQVPNIVNAESMPAHQVHTAQRINQYFHDELIYKRNQRMANRVAKLIRAHPDHSFFFTFGAGHFLGNNTVIDKLRSKGFNVTYTPADSNVYLGEGYARRPLLSELAVDQSSSSLLSPPYMENLPKKHRQRHRNPWSRRKGRRKDQRLQRPQFNDLWVRLEETSFGPNSLFRRLQSPAVPTTSAPPPPQYAMYNNNAAAASSHFSTAHSAILLLAILMLTGGGHYGLPL